MSWVSTIFSQSYSFTWETRVQHWDGNLRRFLSFLSHVVCMCQADPVQMFKITTWCVSWMYTYIEIKLKRLTWLIWVDMMILSIFWECVSFNVLSSIFYVMIQWYLIKICTSLNFIFDRPKRSFFFWRRPQRS